MLLTSFLSAHHSRSTNRTVLEGGGAEEDGEKSISYQRYYQFDVQYVWQDPGGKDAAS